MLKKRELLDIINENKYSIEQIKQLYNLTNKQILFLLKYLKDYTISEQFDLNGNSFFCSDSNSYDQLYYKDRILVPLESNRMNRFLVISDLHFYSNDLNQEQNNKIMCNVYNYAIKNSIHLILICGDLIHGYNDSIINKFDQPYKFINDYPYDKSINNICILGNHDYNLYKEGLNIKEILNNNRLDFISLDYGKGIVSIGDFNIMLRHVIDFKNIKKDEQCFDDNTYKNLDLILRGHSHIFKTYSDIIKVPSVTGAGVRNEEFISIPQFIEIDLRLNKDNQPEHYKIKQILSCNAKIIGEYEYNCKVKCL